MTKDGLLFSFVIACAMLENQLFFTLLYFF
jgi:hypothetical protein